MNENKRQRHGKRAGRLAAAGLAAALLWTGAALARWPRVSAASSQEIQQTLDGLRQQAQEIAEQGAALEQEIGQNQSETKSTIERKSEIDRQIHQTEAEIQNTDAQIQQYSLLIAQKQSQVEDAQAEMSAMQETYKARIRAMEEAGTVSYWAVLFQANSFADLLSRIDTIHEVAEADQRMLEKLKDQAAVLEAARGELETALTEQQALRDGLTEQQAQLAAQRQEADGLLLELAAEGEALSEEFLANAQQEAALRQEILDAQAAYEAALSAEEGGAAGPAEPEQRGRRQRRGGHAGNLRLCCAGGRAPCDYLVLQRAGASALRLHENAPGHRPGQKPGLADLRHRRRDRDHRGVQRGQRVLRIVGPWQRLYQHLLPYDEVHRFRGRLRLPGAGHRLCGLHRLVHRAPSAL